MQITHETIHGWFDFQPIYNRIAYDIREDGIAIELGVWKAKSLIYLANRMLDAGKPNVRVIGIDSFKNEGWDGYNAIQREQANAGEFRSIEEQARANIAALCSKSPELIVSDAIAAAALFEDKSVDFIFVDDTHSSAHLVKELAAWLPKMRRPTWIAGHDYAPNIAEAVDTIFPQRQLSDWTAIYNPCWIAQLP